jgi:hypothetical protein
MFLQWLVLLFARDVNVFGCATRKNGEGGCLFQFSAKILSNGQSLVAA